MNKLSMAVAVCAGLRPLIALGEIQPDHRNGARLYATTRNGDIQKYSATDQRGRALRMKVVQNPPDGTVPSPGSSIERGQQRAEEQHERFLDSAGNALGSGEITGKGCVGVIADAEGGVFSSDR